MEWTDIKTTVPAVWAETAEAIATGISGGGIYIEDYRDLEAQVEAIAHVDLIEQELLDKSRDEVAVHLYIAPDENFAEIGELMRDRLERAEVPYRMEYTGVRQEDWETGWKAYYHAMDIGTRLAVVPSWEAYETDRTVITLDPGMAFGTGTHETTALCLETLDGLVKGGERVARPKRKAWTSTRCACARQAKTRPSMACRTTLRYWWATFPKRPRVYTTSSAPTSWPMPSSTWCRTYPRCWQSMEPFWPAASSTPARMR